MKTLLAIALVLGAVAGTARADDSEAFEGARDWYSAITTGTQPDPVPTRKKPLAYGIDAMGADPCMSLLWGKLVNAAGLTSLTTCLAATIAELGTDIEITSQTTSVSDVLQVFPKKRKKAIKAAARGRTLINTTVTGSNGYLELYFAVDDLGMVKAVWAAFTGG